MYAPFPMSQFVCFADLIFDCDPARRVPLPPHRFHVLQPRSEDQARPRDDHTRIPLQARDHRRGRFEGDGGELCRSVLSAHRSLRHSMLILLGSIGDGEEGDRDQPVPPRDHGGWCSGLSVLVGLLHA